MISQHVWSRAVLELHWRNKLQVLIVVWQYLQYLRMDIYAGSYNQSHLLLQLFMERERYKEVKLQ